MKRQSYHKVIAFYIKEALLSKFVIIPFIILIILTIPKYVAMLHTVKPEYTVNEQIVTIEPENMNDTIYTDFATEEDFIDLQNAQVLYDSITACNKITNANFGLYILDTGTTSDSVQSLVKNCLTSNDINSKVFTSINNDNTLVEFIYDSDYNVYMKVYDSR